ncbi:MAG: GC-type dockerin domain-anchored protein [Planctomycetota bacterium]
MRCSSGISTRAALLVLCAGTAQGVAQDCNLDLIPDQQQTLLWVGPDMFFNDFGDADSWANVFGLPSVPALDTVCLFDPNQSGLGSAVVGVIDPFRQVEGFEVAFGQVDLQLTNSATLRINGDIPGCRETAIGTQRFETTDVDVFGTGLFSAERLVVGVGEDNQATLTFDDIGTNQLGIDVGRLLAGAGGDGTVVVNGGQFRVASNAAIGDQPGRFGSLSLNGSTSQLAFIGPPGQDIVVGQSGDGVLELHPGAMASTDLPIDLIIGAQPGSRGTFSVRANTFNSAEAQLSLTTFEVGRFGTGVLDLSSLGSLRTQTDGIVELASQSGSAATVNIQNAGWTEAFAPVHVGVRGFADLNIRDGGLLDADTRVLRRGSLNGGGTVVGSVGVIGGRIAPFNPDSFSRTLVVEGPLTFSGFDPYNGLFERGRLEIILNDFVGASDSVDATQPVAVNGTLSVLASADLAPAIGDATTILSGFPFVTGQFRGLTVPAFSNNTTLGVVYGPDFVDVVVEPRASQDPTFEPPQGFDTVDGLPQAAAVSGDVTNDGFPDLLVVATDSAGPGRLVLLRNLGVDGNGNWNGYDHPVTFGTVESEPVGIGLGDFNSDDAVDVVFVTRAPGGNGIVRIRSNDPTNLGDFSNLGPSFTIENDPVDLAVGEFNADGVPDVAVAGTFATITSSAEGGMLRTSSGRVTTLNTMTASAEDIDIGVQPGSIDTVGGTSTPGTDDVGVTCVGESMLFVLQNDGAGSFPTFDVEAVGANPTGVNAGDIDGDGEEDLLTTDTDSGTVSIALAIPGSSPTDVAAAISLPTDNLDGSQPRSAVFADLDGDNDLDVAVIARDNGGVPRIRRLLFEGLGPNDELVFLNPQDAAAPAPEEPEPIELLTDDVDGDGLQDLIVLYSDGNAFSASRGPVPIADAEVSVRLNTTSICPADLAAPFGILDLADVDAFIVAFLNNDPAADLAAPFGVIDLSDIDAFITSFLAGCP